MNDYIPIPNVDNFNDNRLLKIYELILHRIETDKTLNDFQLVAFKTIADVFEAEIQIRGLNILN